MKDFLGESVTNRLVALCKDMHNRGSAVCVVTGLVGPGGGVVRADPDYLGEQWFDTVEVDLEDARTGEMLVAHGQVVALLEISGQEDEGEAAMVKWFCNSLPGGRPHHPDIGLPLLAWERPNRAGGARYDVVPMASVRGKTALWECPGTGMYWAVGREIFPV